jgi:hypothetical protein
MLLLLQLSTALFGLGKPAEASCAATSWNKRLFRRPPWSTCAGGLCQMRWQVLLMTHREKEKKRKKRTSSRGRGSWSILSRFRVMMLSISPTWTEIDGFVTACGCGVWRACPTLIAQRMVRSRKLHACAAWRLCTCILEGTHAALEELSDIQIFILLFFAPTPHLRTHSFLVFRVAQCPPLHHYPLAPARCCGKQLRCALHI